MDNEKGVKRITISIMGSQIIELQVQSKVWQLLGEN